MIRGIALAASAIAGAIISRPALAEPAPLPPPYEGPYQPQGVDEVGLWQQLDEEERQLAASPLVIKDETLTSYIKDVLCRTVGHDRCEATRIYIVREPTFNASMTANGTMRVFSGFLLRVRDEAELGYILGHEFGHFEARHTLNEFKAERTSRDVLAWTSLLASMAPSYSAYRSYQDLQLAIYGSLFRYSRDQEREADLLGLGYLNRSGLPPQAAARVWMNVMGELEASAHVRGLKKPNFKSVAFTASHPPHGERAEYLSDLANPAGAERDAGAQRYRGALANWLPSFLDDQIKLNDFGASEYIIEQLAAGGWTADLWFARGELYRARGHQRDLVHAAGFYRSAIALDGARAEAYRGLGLSLLKTGQQSDGQSALRRYLDLKPDAEDAGMIQLMLPKEGEQ